MAEKKSTNPKKLVIVGLIITILVVGAAVAAVVLVKKHLKHKHKKTYKSVPPKYSQDKNKNGTNISTKKKAIEELCQNTYYDQTCINSLEKASDTTDPKILIKTGFEVAIEELYKAINQSESLQKATKDPETAQAYKTCQKLLDDSIRDLQRSIQDMSDSSDGLNLRRFVDDIQTWLTGALTYQDTCLDTLDEAKGHASDEMRQILKASRELTINGLALMNEFSKVLIPDFQASGRRLMGLKTHGLVQVAPEPAKPSGTILENVKPNVVVAKDGSGKYKTINEAVKDIPIKSNQTFVIHIKEGVYEEYVHLNSGMWSVMFLGDGPTKTKITGNKSKLGGVETFWTATVVVEGHNFIAKDIGFENTAGGRMHQAVAVRVTGDQAIFYNCQIDGHQDTLYAHNHRQFYRDCTISGTIDFIFGNARAVFQNCTFLIRKPEDTAKQCMLTAQGRTVVNETSAIVLQNCRVLPGPDYPVNDMSYKTYLGRPWKQYSRTIVMDSEIGGFIRPEGWSPWNDTSAHLDTCWYAEVNNKGPGSDLSKRVNWPGYKKISLEEAVKYTPGEYLLGDTWIAGKGIPYTSGLIKN
ncbi:hypothetical protein BUALT_Bualt14G0118400 [Buddleja alternifolia]|uniref:Pectinesterase n=1 Tax=Buddleja alternifolia TaxID=168488 RepID=A0AAV6WPT3_9LAMI|nr:hypothetical protein BUALT_Bualt14G0118400 [Buddleja alternifolia]